MTEPRPENDLEVTMRLVRSGELPSERLAPALLEAELAVLVDGTPDPTTIEPLVVHRDDANFLAVFTVERRTRRCADGSPRSSQLAHEACADAGERFLDDMAVSDRLAFGGDRGTPTVPPDRVHGSLFAGDDAGIDSGGETVHVPGRIGDSANCQRGLRVPPPSCGVTGAQRAGKAGPMRPHPEDLVVVH